MARYRLVLMERQNGKTLTTVRTIRGDQRKALREAAAAVLRHDAHAVAIYKGTDQVASCRLARSSRTRKYYASCTRVR